MRCRMNNGWCNFITRRYGRVRQVDVMPVTRSERIPYPHRLGVDCPCHPTLELKDDRVPVVIHDHPWTVAR